jgi:hypothetical protein
MRRTPIVVAKIMDYLYVYPTVQMVFSQTIPNLFTPEIGTCCVVG